MITLKDWREFLHECGLVAEQWLHVSRVGEAYIFWRVGRTRAASRSERVQKIMDRFLVNPQAGEATLEQLLREPQDGASEVKETISDEVRQRITEMLHNIAEEKPNPEAQPIPQVFVGRPLEYVCRWNSHRANLNKSMNFSEHGQKTDGVFCVAFAQLRG
jgi:hypothetical protein